uniref:Uncharacterized protein n=1 Tax=Glossina palpalis gambiensis TaxID=67801 RepID=A0A1B0B3K5_9MUSC
MTFLLRFFIGIDLPASLPTPLEHFDRKETETTRRFIWTDIAMPHLYTYTKHVGMPEHSKCCNKIVWLTGRKKNKEAYKERLTKMNCVKNPLFNNLSSMHILLMQLFCFSSSPTRFSTRFSSLSNGLGTETVCNHAKNNANIRNAVITTTLNTNYTLSASLSPPLPQYHMKRSLSPVRFSSQHHHHISNHNHNHNHHHHHHHNHHHNHYQRRTYSSQKVANRLSPIIYTQAPQQPSSKSLVSNLSLYSTYKTTSSCTTTTTAACYNSRICSSHTSSSNKSSCSNLHLSSHQHYHANKFQSDASSLTTISSAKPTSNTLKSLPIADNSNNIAKLCNASGDECGGNVGGSAVALPISSSAASLYPPGSSVTPINYKQKSFMQRKKPMLTRSESQHALHSGLSRDCQGQHI